MKELIAKLKTVKNKIVYKIKKMIHNLLYRQATYYRQATCIPEKGVLVSTVVFPKDLVFTDGEDKATICGVTDVFKVNGNKIEDPIPIYSEYINKRSDAGAIHRSVVEEMKTGYIAIFG